jgi:hypothetical protein
MMVAASVALGRKKISGVSATARRWPAPRREGPGSRRLGAGVEIHHRAREAARHRIAAGEGRAEIGGAEADQLLVGVDALALLGRQRLRDRDRLHEADDRDQERRDETAATRLRRRQARHGERRQALRHLADDGSRPVREPEQAQTAAW